MGSKSMKFQITVLSVADLLDTTLCIIELVSVQRCGTMFMPLALVI
jgi:hypothetical protein